MRGHGLGQTLVLLSDMVAGHCDLCKTGMVSARLPDGLLPKQSVLEETLSEPTVLSHLSPPQ